MTRLRCGLGAALFVALQRVLPQHTLSRGIHRLARTRWAPVKNALIAGFVHGFKPDLGEAREPDARRYTSFNELFTRALRPGARRVDPDPCSVASPVDGTVSQIGHLDGLSLIQAKGRTYSLEALLASQDWAARLAGGAFATLYLAPRNYHRIHLPVAARLTAAWYVPGRLFSVNAVTADAVANLFARNERVVCIFEAAGGLRFAVILVGALFVGSIATHWHGEVAPRRRSSPSSAAGAPRRFGPAGRPGRHPKPLELPVPAAASALEKGAEMGHFSLGSTVILVFPRDALGWLPDLSAGSPIVMGQALGRLKVAP
ncbi:MAG: archaetidylserine decarboxylase [Steroidobacteraceae bacterium]